MPFDVPSSLSNLMTSDKSSDTVSKVFEYTPQQKIISRIDKQIIEARPVILEDVSGEVSEVSDHEVEGATDNSLSTIKHDSI